MTRDAYLRQEVKGHLRVDVPLFRLKKNGVKKVILGHIYTAKPHLCRHRYETEVKAMTILVHSGSELTIQYSFDTFLPAL